MKAPIKLVTALAVAVCGVAAPPAQGALQITEFKLTPSTTKAGGNPNLAFSVAFLGADNRAGIKDIALHLPAGLRARPEATPYCTKKRLIENRCPIFSKIGRLAVTGTALGTSATINRKIYNMRPTGRQKVKLGAIALPGIPVTLPLTARPGGGLDIGVTGVPRIGGGVTVALDRIEIWIRGKGKRRGKRKRRSKPLLVNPKSCVPADTVLDIGFYDLAVPRVTAISSFTPTGC